MTSRSYCLAHLDVSKDDVRDIVTVVDLIRATGHLGRMSYDYLGDEAPAFWTFDKSHFERFEKAVDEAKIARLAQLMENKAIAQFKDVL